MSKIAGVPLVLIILVVLIVLPLLVGELVIARAVLKVDQRVENVQQEVIRQQIKKSEPVVSPTPSVSPSPILRQVVPVAPQATGGAR